MISALIIKAGFLGLTLAISEPGASCGDEMDPYNAKLTIPQSQQLADSLSAILAESAFVAIARMDSNHCVVGGMIYPVLRCSAWVKVDTVLKGDAAPGRFGFSLRSDLPYFFPRIWLRRFLLYSGSFPPRELTIAPGCYSPYRGYYIDRGKFFNKYISDSNYLPVNTLGWSPGDSLAATYLLSNGAVAGATGPRKKYRWRQLGPDKISLYGDEGSLAAILNSAGQDVSEKLLQDNLIWVEAHGRLDTARLEGWDGTDSIFVVERFVGVYLREPSLGVERTKGSGNRRFHSEPDIRLFDARGRRQPASK